MPSSVRQIVPVTQSSIDDTQFTESVAFFTASGTPFSVTPTAPIVVGTAAATAAKTVTDAEPTVNTIVPIRFTLGNTVASPTIAFAGGSARALILAGVAPTAPEIAVAATGIVMCFFDGTNLHMLGAYT